MYTQLQVPILQHTHTHTQDTESENLGWIHTSLTDFVVYESILDSKMGIMWLLHRSSEVTDIKRQVFCKLNILPIAQFSSMPFYIHSRFGFHFLTLM